MTQPTGGVPPTNYQSAPTGPGKPQTLAIIALVCGIASFATCCIGVGYVNLGMVAAIAAIIVGVMARQKIARGEQTGSGLATAGIILGAVNLLLQILVIILVVGLGMAVPMMGERFQAEIDRIEREQQQQMDTSGTSTDDTTTTDTDTTDTPTDTTDTTTDAPAPTPAPATP